MASRARTEGATRLRPWSPLGLPGCGFSKAVRSPLKTLSLTLVPPPNPVP